MEHEGRRLEEVESPASSTTDNEKKDRKRNKKIESNPPLLIFQTGAGNCSATPHPHPHPHPNPPHLTHQPIYKSPDTVGWDLCKVSLEEP